MSDMNDSIQRLNCDYLAETIKEKVAAVYFGDDKGHEKGIYDSFEIVSKGLRSFQFYSAKSECASWYGIDAKRGIAIVRPFDEPHVVYKGSTYVSEMTKWMQKYATPKVFELSERWFTPIFREHNPALLFVSNGKHPAFEIFEGIADDLFGEVLFTYIDLSSEFGREIYETLGLAVNLPNLVLIDPKGDDTFKY